MKYFLRGIIAAILFAVLMFGGLMTGFMVLCYLAVPPMLRAFTKNVRKRLSVSLQMQKKSTLCAIPT